MRNHLMGAALAAAAFTAAAPASATTLVDLTNTYSAGTPYSFQIVATGTSTQLTFGGYHIPADLRAWGISLVSLGGSTNLLGQTWAAAPGGGGCSNQYQYDDGVGTGTNGVQFGAICIGILDEFSQSFASTIGGHYVLSFTYYNDYPGSPTYQPSAFRVITDAALASPVPEPATWAMLLLGFGMVGGAMRSARVRKVTYSAA